MKIKSFLLPCFLFSTFFTYAQHSEKCATMEMQKEAEARDPEVLKKARFLEERTKTFIANLETEKTTLVIYTIPVVVHVIHNGESIGSGTNISDAQILSQLQVLNEDFRKRNKDSLAKSHAFWSATADCEIEFCLAKQDPSGKPTTGITRLNGARSSWEQSSFNEKIKPKTIWNRDKYMNIWVTNFGGVDISLLGYASLPSGGTDTTDGVVISYQAFGTTGTAGTGSFPKNNLGRTSTHEVGHYLNLLHLWGSSTCGDDFVADTEPSEKNNSGCPSYPYHAKNACGSSANGEMFMNYMDYTDDACIVMFTSGQKNRMQAALLSARASLLTSKGCTPAVGISNFDQEFNISVFPNPVSQDLMIESEQKDIEYLVIRNMLGKVVFEKVRTGNLKLNERINISSLPDGIYMLECKSPNKFYRDKIIISK